MAHPVSDMITIIRNAAANCSATVEFPASKLKIAVADGLRREGYVWDYSRVEVGDRLFLRVDLKYGPAGESVIRTIKTVSRPGRRVYVGARAVPNVLQGLGVCLISTNRGVLSGREARSAGVGGELLCEIW